MTNHTTQSNQRSSQHPVSGKTAGQNTGAVAQTKITPKAPAHPSNKQPKNLSDSHSNGIHIPVPVNISGCLLLG